MNRRFATPSAVEVLEAALRWRDSGQPVALATVIGTWGSSPCPVGSQLAVDGQGHFVGSVSAGCVEATVIAAAREVLNERRGRRLDFGVSDQTAWDVGLSCGGRLQVYLEPIEGKPAVLASLLASVRAKQAIARVTNLDSGQQALVTKDGEASTAFAASIVSAAKRALATEQSSLMQTETGPVFVHTFHPPLRLVIVGAVHLAQALAQFAELSGYEVIIIDPRRAFSDRVRFPGVAVINAWPDEALRRLSLDQRSSVITLTHDPKFDDRALGAALNSPCFYIGALGSRKTHAARLERLKRAGFGAAELERIHGPVGLDIAARTPAEIALSILAEITRERRADQDTRSSTGGRTATTLGCR